MSFSEQHLMEILSDESKSIYQDLVWHCDQDQSPAKEFRADVATNTGYPLFICGRYNPMAKKLSYTLIYRGVGRIYALDLGREHCNPSGEPVGEKHKHRWNDRYRDKFAYVPDDITAPWNQPVWVWEQFCSEARILHMGTLAVPVPTVQEELHL